MPLEGIVHFICLRFYKRFGEENFCEKLKLSFYCFRDTFKWLFDTFQSHAGVYYTSELISFFPKELGEISLLYESLLSLRTTDTQLSHYLFISDVFFRFQLFSSPPSSTCFLLWPTTWRKKNGKLSHAIFQSRNCIQNEVKKWNFCNHEMLCKVKSLSFWIFKKLKKKQPKILSISGEDYGNHKTGEKTKFRKFEVLFTRELRNGLKIMPN